MQILMTLSRNSFVSLSLDSFTGKISERRMVVSEREREREREKISKWKNNKDTERPLTGKGHTEDKKDSSVIVYSYQNREVRLYFLDKQLP